MFPEITIKCPYCGHLFGGSELWYTCYCPKCDGFIQEGDIKEVDRKGDSEGGK